MSLEELKRRTEVQQAYLDGKMIEVTSREADIWTGKQKWTPIDNPLFDWNNYDYRVKPEEIIIRPWINIVNQWGYETKESADRAWERYLNFEGMKHFQSGRMAFPKPRLERLACKQIEIRYYRGEGL